MLGRLSIETIGRQLVLALEDFEAFMRRSDRDGAPHPANAAGAAPRRGKTLGQLGSELYGPAVTGAAESDGVGGLRVDQAATFSKASLTASSASFALAPSGPPPCAMSGRP